MKKIFINRLFVAVFGIIAISSIGLFLSCSDKETQSETNIHDPNYDTTNFPLVFFYTKTDEKVELIKADGSKVYLEQDVLHDKLIQLRLIKKIDGYFQVDAWRTFDDDFPGICLIPDTTPIYVYLKNVKDYGCKFKLYDEPDYGSSYKTVENVFKAKVIDVSGKWLKIEFQCRSEMVSGWIPEEDQEGDLYAVVGS